MFAIIKKSRRVEKVIGVNLIILTSVFSIWLGRGVEVASKKMEPDMKQKIFAVIIGIAMIVMYTIFLW